MLKTFFITSTLGLILLCFGKESILNNNLEKIYSLSSKVQLENNNKMNQEVSPESVVPSKDLKAYAQTAIREKYSGIPANELDKIQVSAYTWDFLKTGYVVFISVYVRPSSFAHDRGIIDKNNYFRGLWSEKKGRALDPSEYGQAFTRYDLNFEEAISFWKLYAGESSYETEAKKAIFKGSDAIAPSYENRVLTICSYQYTGMKGNFYNYYTVKFPSNKKDGFLLTRK